MRRTRASVKASEEEQSVPRNQHLDVESGPLPRASDFNSTIRRFKYDASNGTSSELASPSTADTDDTAPVVNARKRRLVPTGAEISKPRATTHAPKKRRQSSKYAPPSQYAHLSPLTDILEPNLIGVFVGFNPGVQTATAGHAYAHPSNYFWKLLHSSGVTERRLKPEEDVTLPRKYGMGNTNLVSRPTKDAAQLSKEEQLASVPILEAKIRRFKPEAVCIVGKSIWENIWCYHKGKKPSKTEFKYGWQEEPHNMGLIKCDDDTEEDKKWKGARVFVATSTSGLSANLKPAEKEAIWKPFGEWVLKRRTERGQAGGQGQISET